MVAKEPISATEAIERIKKIVSDDKLSPTEQLAIVSMILQKDIVA